MGLTSAHGLQGQSMALIGVLFAGLVSLAFCEMARYILQASRTGCLRAPAPAPPTLQAALAAIGNEDPAVGYSVSYPFGVAGPILSSISFSSS